MIIAMISTAGTLTVAIIGIIIAIKILTVKQKVILSALVVILMVILFGTVWNLNKPNGYVISASSTTVELNETFNVYVAPKRNNAESMTIYAVSPDGEITAIDNFQSGKEYQIYKSRGVWKLYIGLSNEFGTYIGTKLNETLEIEVI